MFSPRGIAFFGGVNTPASFGHLVLLSQMRYGYQGRLYPVSEKGGTVAGVPILKSLAEADGPVDLAAVSVPASAVPEVLRQCLANGVAGVQVHSSGFGETGEAEGRRLQDELKAIANQGLRIIGPNCFGLHSPAGGITVLPGSDFSKEPGGLALISQSGGVATDFGYEAARAGLRISKAASFGNGVDVDAATLLEYFAHDPETKVIAAYIEGVPDAGRFLELLKATTPRKPVVVWKAGLTPLGRRAAQSHTGSLAGAADLWTGALRQAGAVSVQGLDEMMDALVGLHYFRNRGSRVALVGGGGAIGVYSSDLAYRHGLDLPAFSEETQAELRRHFPTPGNSMVNPLDTGTPVLDLKILKNICRIVLEREPVDLLLVILLLRPIEREINNFMTMMGLPVPAAGSYLEALVEPLAGLRGETGKDVAVVLDNRAHLAQDIEVEAVARRVAPLFQARGIAVFSDAKRALGAVRLARRS
jgi:acyl-CoA synthetase (NDP forming)